MKFIKDIIKNKKIAEEGAREGLGVPPLSLRQEDRADRLETGLSDDDSQFFARLEDAERRLDADESEALAAYDPEPAVAEESFAEDLSAAFTWEDADELPPMDAADTLHPEDPEDVADSENVAESEDVAEQTEARNIFLDDAPLQTPLPAEAIQPEEMAAEAEIASIPDASDDLEPDLSLERAVSDVTASVRDMGLDEAPAEPAPAPAEIASITPDTGEEQPAASIEAPKPQAGRSAGRSGRVKTRLLGFSGGRAVSSNPFGAEKAAPDAGFSNFPVGWLVVTKGPGKGAAFPIFDGLTQIGRGEDQTVRLNFGDNSISRENHASIAYDPEQRQFYLGHGGKANLVRLNGRPVLSTEDLPSKSQIRIGETTLRFVALCGDDFSWDEDGTKDARNALIG